MGRDASDAEWRAFEQLITIMLANVETQLAAELVKFPGLTVDVPGKNAFFAFATERSVRDSGQKNQPTAVFVHRTPANRVRVARTVGTTFKSQPSHFEVTIAALTINQIADDYVPSWKDALVAEEREYLRNSVIVGAIQNAVDGNARGPALTGDNIIQVEFIDSRIGVDAYKLDPKEPGTWGVSRWLVRQIINVPLQT